MSIVRIGLGENKEFGDGYEAIFGKKEDKKKAEDKQEETKKEEAKTDKK